MGQHGSHELSPDFAAAFANDAPAVGTPATPTTHQNGANAWNQQSTPSVIDAGAITDSSLLSSLLQLLASRSPQVLLLSDLGALLPGDLRHTVKERGGLRSWLQKFPDLFLVSGQPGKETVMLKLASEKQGPLTSQQVEQEISSAVGESEELRKKEEEDNESAVQLRGLPYRATVHDVKVFLGRHAANLKDDNSVQLVLNRDGRPSGFARVQFTSVQAAIAARDERHMQLMEVAGAPPERSPQSKELGGGDRYVEIFLFSERPNKLRFKKLVSAIETPAHEEEDIEAMGFNKEQIVQECRVHMRTPGKGQLLLSMLGVALSAEARLYLKKTDQGLKHFLCQYPEEFSVEGGKGRECITYMPAMRDGGLNNRDLPSNFSQHPIDTQRPALSAPPGTMQLPAAPTKRASETGSINELQKPPAAKPNRWDDPAHLPETPKLALRHEHGLVSAHGMATPSDWGTPQLSGRWDCRSEAKPNSQSAVGSGLGSGLAIGSMPTPFTAPSASDLQAAGMAAVAASGFNPFAPWMPMPSMPPPSAFWGNTNSPFWPGAPGMMPGMPPPGTDAAAMAAMLSAFASPLEGSTMPTASTSSFPPSYLEHGGFAAALAASSMASPGGLPGMPPVSWPMPTGAPPAQPASLARPPSRSAGGPGSPIVALRLRGLPYTACEQDIFAFFARHDVVEYISEGPQAVRMITKSNGKPTGHAVVQMNSFADAEAALQALYGKYMSSRYIEVFHDSGEDAVEVLETPNQIDAVTAPPVWRSQAGLFDGAGDTGGSGTQGNNSWDKLFAFMKADEHGQVPMPGTMS